MFTKITQEKAGIIPSSTATFCLKKGGVQFQINGNPYNIMALLYNAGGAGDVSSVKIKGSNIDWLPMSRNWGMNWEIGTKLTGQSLLFQVTVSDGKMVEFDDVVSIDWQFGQVFDSKQNY
ncbi:hypothetical protein V6N13_028437 [Hibiscus sabdariffa]